LGLSNTRHLCFSQVRSMAVLIYTTPTCQYCSKAKSYLRERGIPFRELDVSKNPSAAREMVRKSGQMGVPVLDINGKVIIGFDKAKINQSLGIRG